MTFRRSSPQLPSALLLLVQLQLCAAQLPAGRIMLGKRRNSSGEPDTDHGKPSTPPSGPDPPVTTTSTIFTQTVISPTTIQSGSNTAIQHGSATVQTGVNATGSSSTPTSPAIDSNTLSNSFSSQSSSASQTTTALISQTSGISAAPAPSSSNIHAGGIAGIVAGTVIFLLLASLCLFNYRKRLRGDQAKARTSGSQAIRDRNSSPTTHEFPTTEMSETQLFSSPVLSARSHPSSHPLSPLSSHTSHPPSIHTSLSPLLSDKRHSESIDRTRSFTTASDIDSSSSSHSELQRPPPVWAGSALPLGFSTSISETSQSESGSATELSRNTSVLHSDMTRYQKELQRDIEKGEQPEMETVDPPPSYSPI